MSDPEHPEQELPEEVARLAAALRADVPVRPAWRDAVLREIDTLPAPGAGRPASGRAWTRRRIAFSPMGLAAAAVACIAIGAAGAAALLRAPGAADAPMPADTVPSSDVRTVADVRTLGTTGHGGTAVRFVIVAPNASRVSVVGNFNGWNPTAAPMERVEGGEAWVRDVVLESGRHVYAFLVDGAIHVDPAAPRAAEDDFGIPSSAIVVPPVPQ